jgi:hypothetical protein
VKLELSIEEINYILSVLADRPYRESVGVIDKIKSQEPKEK